MTSLSEWLWLPLHHPLHCCHPLPHHRQAPPCDAGRQRSPFRRSASVSPNLRKGPRIVALISCQTHCSTVYRTGRGARYYVCPHLPLFCQITLSFNRLKLPPSCLLLAVAIIRKIALEVRAQEVVILCARRLPATATTITNRTPAAPVARNSSRRLVLSAYYRNSLSDATTYSLHSGSGTRSASAASPSCRTAAAASYFSAVCALFAPRH